MHYRALPSLRKMVTGLPEIQVEHDSVCRGCGHGKNAKGSFPNNDGQSKGILDLVHLDVCELMSVPSLSVYLYYVIFIDHFSRKTWIYFLKSKNEVFNRFQQFKALVENQTGKHIWVLRTHNGGEFTSNDFDDLCRDARIKRELTISYNPQQNRLVERKNRSICDVAKAMIRDQDLPMSLWEEASSIVVYVQNRSHDRILANKTPEEAFTGVKPKVSHLRIFGCPMYIHVPKEKRSKIEPSGKKRTFVGYIETLKAFWIYVPSQRQIEVSRDVTFDEEVACSRDLESLSWRLTVRSSRLPDMQISLLQTLIVQMFRGRRQLIQLIQ